MALRITSELVKFKNLKSRLGVPAYAVLGVLESLWHFTAKNAIRGDVGRHSNQEIAAWIEWEGDADKLIEALTECRWLDRHREHRLIVHDWHQHADKSVKTILRNRNLSFAHAENVTEIPKEITGHPVIPIGSPPESRVQGAGPESGEQGRDAGTVPLPAPVENPFLPPPPKPAIVNPIARFDEQSQRESREAFSDWRMWRDGCLPNLHTDSAHKELNRLAAAAEAQPGTVPQKLKAFVKNPPPGWPRDVPLWKILKHLGYDAEVVASKPPPKPEFKPITADELVQQQKAYELLHPPMTQERKAELKAQIAETKRKALEAAL